MIQFDKYKVSPFNKPNSFIMTYQYSYNVAAWAGLNNFKCDTVIVEATSTGYKQIIHKEDLKKLNEYLLICYDDESNYANSYFYISEPKEVVEFIDYSIKNDGYSRIELFDFNEKEYSNSILNFIESISRIK